MEWDDRGGEVNMRRFFLLELGDGFSLRFLFPFSDNLVLWLRKYLMNF